VLALVLYFNVCELMFITGPPTHSVQGQTSNGRCRSSSSSSVTLGYATSLTNGQHATAARDGGPVVLLPVRAIPCCFVAAVFAPIRVF